MARASDMIDGANSIVCALGYVAAETAIGGAGAAISGVASLNNLRQRVFNRTPDIAQRVARALDTALKNPTVHMPKDGPQILPQMFERIRVTPQDVIEANRNPSKLATAMLKKAQGYDTKNRDDLDTAFTGILTPILEELLADPQVADTLRPIYEQAVAETLAFIADQVSVLTEQFRQSVEELGLQKGLIIALAQRIAPQVDDIDAAHRELQRAIELAAEAQQTGALPSNLSKAVTEVMTRVDALNAEGRVDEGMAALDRAMQEAEDRIAEAQAGKLKLIDKGLIQTRLTRDVAKATALLLDRLALEGGGFEALRAVQDEWYERGRDKGLRFDLEVAIALARESLTRATGPDQRGIALNDLGLALWVLGKRESGTDRLLEAFQAYRDALKEYTRDRVPLDWAATQNNLGTTLQTLGERESGTDRLLEAVQAYCDALKERTRDRVPLDWAMTQNNLGNALSNLGARESGTDRLLEAVQAYRDALREWTRDRVPLDWAMTQNNLGNALQTLGERESGTDRLQEAVQAYRDTLKELTRDRMPLDWASTQNNLGAALQTLGERESGTDRLLEAVQAYRDALKERTRDRLPLDWALTQNNLGNALQKLGERESGTDRLQEAVQAYRDALKELTRDRVPLAWAMTQENLALAEQALAAKTAGAAARGHLEQALGHVSAALEVFSPEASPYYHEKATRLRDDLTAQLNPND